MRDIYSLTIEDLAGFMIKTGQQRYRADQVYEWLYRRLAKSFDDMTNLSKTLRGELSQQFNMIPMRRLMRETSEDGTEKYLFELTDGNLIESVLIDHLDRKTFCVSTQVGCPVKCAFCATGQSGFVRNLTAGEIVYQVVEIERCLGGLGGINVVFMGMGEPLLNIENLLKSIRILNSLQGRAIGIRRFTISTVGIPEGIRTIGEVVPGVKLSVSIHAPSDSVRDKLVPLNKQYRLSTLIKALKEYVEHTGNRITFEYVLIEEVNDSPEDARDLSELVSGLPSYVNLIPLNPTDSEYRRPSSDRIRSFHKELEERGIEAFVRIEKGGDIEAACGQLRIRYLEGG